MPHRSSDACPTCETPRDILAMEALKLDMANQTRVSPARDKTGRHAPLAFRIPQLSCLGASDVSLCTRGVVALRVYKARMPVRSYKRISKSSTHRVGYAEIRVLTELSLVVAQLLENVIA